MPTDLERALLRWRLLVKPAFESDSVAVATTQMGQRLDDDRRGLANPPIQNEKWMNNQFLKKIKDAKK